MFIWSPVFCTLLNERDNIVLGSISIVAGNVIYNIILVFVRKEGRILPGRRKVHALDKLALAVEHTVAQSIFCGLIQFRQFLKLVDKRGRHKNQP